MMKVARPSQVISESNDPTLAVAISNYMVPFDIDEWKCCEKFLKSKLGYMSANIHEPALQGEIT